MKSKIERHVFFFVFFFWWAFIAYKLHYNAIHLMTVLGIKCFDVTVPIMIMLILQPWHHGHLLWCVTHGLAKRCSSEKLGNKFSANQPTGLRLYGEDIAHYTNMVTYILKKKKKPFLLTQPFPEQGASQSADKIYKIT